MSKTPLVEGKKIMKSGKLLGGGACLIFTQRFGNVDI